MSHMVCVCVLYTKKNCRNKTHYRTYVKLELRTYETQIVHITAVRYFAIACNCNHLNSYMNLYTNNGPGPWTNVSRAHFHFINSRELTVLIDCMCWTGSFVEEQRPEKSCIRCFAVFYLICYQQYFPSPHGWERVRTYINASRQEFNITTDVHHSDFRICN